MKKKWDFYGIAKRVFDVAVSVVALVILWPVFLLVACSIWAFDGSPVFFIQPRVGLNGRLFGMIKFRSMLSGAPTVMNSDGSAYSGPNDPRITKTGNILRKTSLDELPQLVNVLKGEMSLVGPRPDPPEFISSYRVQDHRRLTVKPGLTGWAAIHGRNAVPWERRRDLDLEYIDRRNFSLDIEIICRTIPLLLTGRGVVHKK